MSQFTFGNQNVCVYFSATEEQVTQNEAGDNRSVRTGQGELGNRRPYYSGFAAQDVKVNLSKLVYLRAARKFVTDARTAT
jgi:hypothetical protein